jgi:hypothetical protein
MPSGKDGLNKLILQRQILTSQSTIGELDVFGTKVFTLEDTRRLHKVWGETRIPAGVYAIGLRSAGGMHERYKARYGDTHHGMIWIKDVPLFEWIYIHVGNTAADTQGCILVGLNKGDNCLYNSREAYSVIYSPIVEAVWDTGCILEINDEE